MPSVQRIVSLIGPGAAADDGGGRVGRFAGGHERGRPLARRRHSHVKHQRAGERGQRGIIQRRRMFGIAFMTRDQRHGRSYVAVREPNARVTAGGQRCGDSRHDFVIDVRRFQSLHFFCQSTEDDRIAPFEPHHVLAGPRHFTNCSIDFALLPNGRSRLVAAQAEQFALAGAWRKIAGFTR